MDKIISISLMQEKPCAAVFQYGNPVLIPGVSNLPDRFASSKSDSAAFLGNPAMKAIAVVPSFYTMRQRDALIKEARKASLELKRFISPPAAAALMDYRRKKDYYCSGEEKNVLICTLINGTFDAAAAVIGSGAVEILATAGIASRDPEAIENTLQKLLEQAERKSNAFHRVLMVGDAYYVPEIQTSLLSCVTTDTLVGVYGEEEAVLGGAVQCGVLEGLVTDLLLLNVTPHSIGIKTEGGEFTCLIQRNTTYPTQQKQVFTNIRDNQANYEVCLYEGEQKQAEQNTRISCFHFAEIPLCPKDTARIEITADINPDGILTITAKDLASGKMLKMTHGGTGSNELLKPVTEKSEKPVEKTLPVSPSAAFPDAGAEDLILKFLPVYDDLMLALEQPTKDEAFKKGVRLTMKKLTAVFKELGAEFYGDRGETFDPKLHNAVMHIHSPQYGENTITKVLQKGVKLHGKIIRFAMVQVAN